MEKLGTLESEVLSHEVVDGRVKVVVRTVPGMKLPRVVRPVLRGKEVEFVDTRTFLQRDKGKLPFAQTFRTVNNITERASVAGTIVIDRAPVPIRGPDPSMVMGTMMGTVIRVQGECVVRIAGLGGKVEAIIVQNLKNAYGKLPDIVGEWVATREARVAATRPEGFTGRSVPGPSIALGNLGAMDDVSSADVSNQETSPRLIRASSGVAESEDGSVGSDGSSASFHSADSFVQARGTFDESWGEARGAGAAANDSGTSPRLSTPSFAANRSRLPLPLSPRGAETHDAETTRTPAASGLTPHAFESDSPLETPEFFRRASNGPSNAREGEPRAAAARSASAVADARRGGEERRERLEGSDGDIDSADERARGASRWPRDRRDRRSVAAELRGFERHLDDSAGRLTRGNATKGGSLSAVARWCCCAPGQPGSPLLDVADEGENPAASDGSPSSRASSPGAVDAAALAWGPADDADLRTPLTPGTTKTKRRSRR